MYQTRFAIKESAPSYPQPETDTFEELPSASFVIVPAIIQDVYNDLVAQLGELMNTKALQKRLDRGLQVALDGKVTYTEDPNVFRVTGSTHPFYTVDLLARTCDCPDCSGIPANYCKHRIAAYLCKEALARTPEPEPEPDIPSDDKELEDLLEEFADPQIIGVVNVAYVTMRYHGKNLKLELVETSDGQFSTRVILPESTPIWLNTTDRQAIAEAAAEYL